jgi:hypothetical protein
MISLSGAQSLDDERMLDWPETAIPADGSQPPWNGGVRGMLSAQRAIFSPVS